MKPRLIVCLSSFCLIASQGCFAGCGDEWGCRSSTSSYYPTGPGYSCAGPGPGTSCCCADPSCREENPCLSPEKCCKAFGNISGIEGFPND